MPDIKKVFGRPSTTVVVGYPLCTPEEMGHNDERDGPVIYANEWFLPRLLVDLGVAPSVSEVRRVARQRRGPDVPESQCQIFRYLKGPETVFLKWGKHRIFILVGFRTEAERERRLAEIAQDKG